MSVKIKNAGKNHGKDEFTVKAQAQDKDGDDDLTKLAYEVKDTSGTVIGSETVTRSATKKIQPGTVTISSSEDVTKSGSYTVTVTAEDSDGNTKSDSTTV